MVRGCLLDHHLDGVDPQGQLLALGDGVGDPATAVGELRVEVDPAARLGLDHQ